LRPVDNGAGTYPPTMKRFADSLVRQKAQAAAWLQDVDIDLPQIS